MSTPEQTDAEPARQALENRLQALDQTQQGSAHYEALFAAVKQFETTSGLLYRLRQHRGPGDPTLERLEDTMARASHRLLAGSSSAASKDGYSAWLQRYRVIWRENLALFVMTLLVFVACSLIGWNIATALPDYLPVILPQHNMENILQNNAWFEELNKNPLQGGIQIAVNNIQVAIHAFLAGAILGVGGLVILGFNGVMLGAVFGYCYANGFHRPLAEFVLGHGPLELTIIIASTFASLLVGRAFFRRPYRHFARNMRKYGRDAGVVVAGIVPWLLLAGFVEAFISPRPGLSLTTKLAVGMSIAAAFWIWTFWPEALRVRTPSPVKRKATGASYRKP